MPRQIFQVDAFTRDPFSGNPAAVCLLDQPAQPEWMQHVAAEMNQAETAFVHPIDDGFALRWFTPKVEVDLCGHATLASAHILWETRQVDAGQAVRFHTKSGVLTCVKKGDWIEMDFPATPAEPSEAPRGLLDAIGLAQATVGRSRFDFLLELDSEALLRALKPDFAMLRQIPTRGVIITARASGEFDFVSRFFAPRIGVDEDPVTGSAHCALGPWWGQRVGKARMLGYQASTRGGTVRVEVRGDRVLLGGQAVTTLRGELLA